VEAVEIGKQPRQDEVERRMKLLFTTSYLGDTKAVTQVTSLLKDIRLGKSDDV
jgi:hypothetical protein